MAAAEAAVILLHGRGATAESMFEFERLLDLDDKVAWIAPQADQNTWYPNSFLAPLSHNQPYLAGALARIDEVVESVLVEGVAAERIALLGFSQGACLALEYAARFGRNLGAVIALSGGLIGTVQKRDVRPPDDKEFQYPGRLDGVPFFLGCSDVDAHIPLARVERSAAVLKDLGAEVEARIYPGMGHTVNADEIRMARDLLARCCAKGANGLQ